MENCIFCKIVKGEIPAIKIWEGENSLAFLDINPMVPGHTLLIPKKHTDYLFDIGDDEYCGLMQDAKTVAKILKQKMGTKRIGVVVEGFLVPHAHVHLLPINRFEDMNPLNAKPAKIEDLKKIADKILKKD